MEQSIRSHSDYESAWGQIQQRLKEAFGEAKYTHWLRHLSLGAVEGDEIILYTPSRFIREWVAGHYAESILSIWKEYFRHLQALEIRVDKDAKSMPSPEPETKIASGVDVSGQNVALMEQNYVSFASPLDQRFAFDRFVTGGSNELAFAAAKAVGEGNGPAYPLYIHGGVGCGKTHLMHAIAWEITRQNQEAKLMYISAEKFMYQYVNALRSKDIMSFKSQFRDLDVLLIDDIQFICGKESTQEEFFHTYHALMSAGKSVVIAGDRPPSDLDGLKRRISSHFGGGLVVDIRPADYELRLGILRSKLAHMENIIVPEEVLAFIALHITSNIRELEGALNKLVAHSTLVKQEITLPSCKEILRDLLRANEKSITIAHIQKTVAEYFNIKVGDLKSNRRLRAISRPRQIAMYLSKQFTVLSLSDIGQRFGGKDHTTVMYAMKKTQALQLNDREFHQDLESLIQLLQ